jgi:hypothetical protein
MAVQGGQDQVRCCAFTHALCLIVKRPDGPRNEPLGWEDSGNVRSCTVPKHFTSSSTNFEPVCSHQELLLPLTGFSRFNHVILKVAEWDFLFLLI